MDTVSLGCCFLAFVLYYNTLDAGFVYDDRRAILNNPDVHSTSSWWNLLKNDFWGTPLNDSGSHGSYRPLCVLTFKLNYLLGGFQPWGYHLVNVILHVLATGLLVQVARIVFPKERNYKIGRTIAGLLFASHPIHTEAVAGIVGRADLAACNFYLLSFLMYVSHVKYRDNACTKLYQCVDVRNETKFRCSRHCERRHGKVSGNYGQGTRPLSNSSKYHSFLISLRNQVTNCYASSNEFCCMKHNVMLSALSFTGSRGLAFTGSRSHTESAHSNYCGSLDSANFNSRTLLWCLCGVQGFNCWRRIIKQWITLVGCLVCATAALFSKETGITVLIVCAVYDLVRTPTHFFKKSQIRSIAILGVGLIVLICLRMKISMGLTPTFSTADNPIARAPSFLTRFYTFLYLPTFNFQLLLCPTVLSFDWSMDAVPRINSVFDPRNLLSLGFYYILYKIVKCAFHKIVSYPDSSRKDIKRLARMCRVNKREITTVVASSGPLAGQGYLPAACPCQVCHQSLEDHHSPSCRTSNNNNSVSSSHSMCICPPPTIHARHSRRTAVKSSGATTLLACAFLVLPFLPATNLFFYVGFVVAERILYLPSVGYCLLIGLGATKLWKQRRYCYICLTIVLVMFGARTLRRNLDWKDEESLYRSAIPVNPPKAYGNLGSVLSSQGRTTEAEWAYTRALEYRVNMADVHYNLGVLLQGRQNLDAAIRSYQRAIHFRPSLALAYVNLGGALVAAGRCQEAVSVLRQGSQLDGTGLKDRRVHETARVSALLQLGALYADQGRLQRALAVYREALHTMPQHYPPQSVYNLLGETLTRLQQFEEAERWYQAALQAQPDHVPAHITYGKLLAKNSSRVVEAEQWFRRAQRLAPTDPSVYHHYGEFLASMHRHGEAAVQYMQAAELRPHDYELVVAAATALRQADRRHDAELWYRQAVQLRPTDARGHTNLGAILHLNGKYREAAASYREALRLQPNDVTTLTNLHKLYSLMA